MRTYRLPPPGLACVMQDLKLLSFNVQWFRDLGASFSSFECSVFESWVLRFRVLGASNRFRDLGAPFSSASFSKLPNFDLGNTVYISSQAFYAGVDPFDDFE